MSTSKPWVRLARVYGERLARPLLLSICTLVPVCLLFAKKDGGELQDLLRYFTLTAVILPFTTGGIITRSKADGSLAFLATLPVAKHDHARSWFVVTLLLSTPLAVSVMTSSYLPPLQLRGAPLAAAGISAAVLIASAVMAMNAFQLSVPPSTAGLYFMLGIMAAVGFISGLGQLFEVSSTTLITTLREPWFLPALSGLIWLCAAIALWWAWHRIGHFMTSYVGEPPKA